MRPYARNLSNNAIAGIDEGIVSTEIARLGGMKESGIGPCGGPVGLETRHRSRIPLRGRSTDGFRATPIVLAFDMRL
jgi:hypothetical protein